MCHVIINHFLLSQRPEGGRGEGGRGGQGGRGGEGEVNLLLEIM